MWDFVRRLFDADYMPHIYCMRNEPFLVRMHFISDAAIALAYYTIPIALIYFVRKRKDVAFSYMFILFGAFIFACGTTHLLSVYTMWNPVYRIEGVVKLFTAVISIYTSILLWPLMPRALALPSPAQLETANHQLELEVKDRQEAERAVRRLNSELEERVQQRTTELTRSNKELQERTGEMEQFTYTVSHDLKSPLVTVQGFAGLIEQDVAAGRTDRLNEFSREIRSAGQHMAELIADLLELSRIGRIVNRIEPVSIGQLAHAVTEEHQLAIREKAIEVRIQPDLPTLLADAGRIRQVLDNLVLNAIKYGCDRPHPFIEIGARESGDLIEVFVRDDGHGIPAEYHAKIFDLFQRLHVDQEGTGVGLAIVKRIVELHGGRVRVESAPQQGTTFWLSFPRTMLAIT